MKQGLLAMSRANLPCARVSQQAQSPALWTSHAAGPLPDFLFLYVQWHFLLIGCVLVEILSTELLLLDLEKSFGQPCCGGLGFRVYKQSVQIRSESRVYTNVGAVYR